MATSAYKQDNCGKAIEFDSEDERIRYLIDVFPKLARAGKCVEAMELYHGTGRLNWLFRPFYGLSGWVARMNAQRADWKRNESKDRLNLSVSLPRLS